MSNLELFADDIDGYLFVAITDNTKLVDLYISKPQVNGSWASIYKGKITKIDTKLNAAFVDLGDGLTGILLAADAIPQNQYEEDRNKEISKILKCGDTLLVQVKVEGKEDSLYENHKLPRLTTNLHVPGGFIIYNPQDNSIKFLGNIDDKILNELEVEVNKPSGWKCYPSKNKFSKADAYLEINYLKKHWQEILDKSAKLQDKAGLIEIGPISIFRAFSDYGAYSFANIHTGNRLILNIVEDWSKKHLPQLATSKRLRLFKPSKVGERLFDIHDLYGEIEKLKSPVVEMSNGGNMIIEHTSALNTIDLNQGSATDRDDVNFKAVEEIARQIKLRNLSGVILIDFIGSIPQKQKRLQIIESLEKNVEHDVGMAQVHGFTRLGIVEITRRRRTASFHEEINI